MSGTSSNVRSAIRGLGAAMWNKLPVAGSRFYVFITLILPVLTSYATTWTLYDRQTRDASQNKEKSAFIDEARSLDILINNYVQQVIVGEKPSPEALQQLSSNLIKQAQLLNDVSKYLPEPKGDLVSDYGKALVSFKSILPESNSVLKLRPFWEDASKIVVLRNRIIRQLQA